jgi:hypothetical protein
MNRYIMVRGLRGPAFILLVGLLALLSQAHILGWGKSWPLFLILAGLLKLAERAALSSLSNYPPPYPGAPDPRTATGVPPYPGQPVAHFPSEPQDSVENPEKGEL